MVRLIEDGQVPIRFIYATKSNVPDYMVRGAVTYRIISDHLGSPRLVVNTTTGAIAQRLDYDEFGNITTDTNPGFQPFGFAGGLYDVDTGLVRFGLRDYDSKTGRWTSKDPIRFNGGDTNLYGYVANDPINFVDTSGLWLINNSDKPVVFKPEHGTPKLLPKGGGYYPGGIDGVKPPSWGGDWMKVRGFNDTITTNVTIDKDGNPHASGPLPIIFPPIRLKEAPDNEWKYNPKTIPLWKPTHSPSPPLPINHYPIPFTPDKLPWEDFPYGEGCVI